jgi:hypothetical protein
MRAWGAASRRLSTMAAPAAAARPAPPLDAAAVARVAALPGRQFRTFLRTAAAALFVNDAAAVVAARTAARGADVSTDDGNR